MTSTNCNQPQTTIQFNPTLHLQIKKLSRNKSNSRLGESNTLSPLITVKLRLTDISRDAKKYLLIEDI
ncbi:CLUMA_CG015686, isoform A [Clunio marinus]|uniref:CLUMA_CG015686, isoform A n=1 Tax=Clunio marinus TaxID=568069 RepID=A0A1J1IPK6_9DIPT|nr:CLUMA_CG015686, isoform A [Clunio marinus]